MYRTGHFHCFLTVGRQESTGELGRDHIAILPALPLLLSPGVHGMSWETLSQRAHRERFTELENSKSWVVSQPKSSISTREKKVLELFRRSWATGLFLRGKERGSGPWSQVYHVFPVWWMKQGTFARYVMSVWHTRQMLSIWCAGSGSGAELLLDCSCPISLVLGVWPELSHLAWCWASVYQVEPRKATASRACRSIKEQSSDLTCVGFFHYFMPSRIKVYFPRKRAKWHLAF